MISLREFAYEIRQRIDDGRTTEAVPLAQYLLRRHPRYLRGYQLLAEAALEQGNLTDAIEIFSRVLSADPESFPAHAGLASAYSDQNELDNALWHMTRAFESEPGMKAVRDQLRYLYELRDGRAPGRLHLNSAALARSYLRNGSYDVAVEELTHEIGNDPDRIDLRVALAEAYWFANQPQESAQVAYQVLEELPLALKPHLILGAFYYQAGEMEQAETHLRIAQELDPENDTAIAIFGDGTPFRAIAIPIDEPGNISKGTAPLGGGTQLPEWLRDLSLFASPEAPTDGVDWDAIIAYEDDWRTQLAGATRDALTAYKPNWRANLRLATVRALRERGLAYPAPAPEPTAEPTVDPIPEVSADWRDTLYSDTVTTLVEGQSDEIVSAEVWQPEETITEPIEMLAPEWQAALRFATEEALATYQPSQDEQEIEWSHDPTIDLPQLVFPPADTSEWVHALRDATDTLFSPAESATVAPEVAELETLALVAEPVAFVETAEPVAAPRQRLVGRWIPTLRVSTEIWVAMQRRSEKRGTGTLVPPDPIEPDPVSQAFDSTIVEPSATPIEVEEVNPQITDAEEWSFAESTEATTDAEAENGTEPIIEATEAVDAIAEPFEPIETTIEFSEVVEPSDTLFEVDLIEESSDSPVPEELTAATPLEEARQLWQDGQVKEAVGRYQILFYEESVPDEALSDALAEWVSTDTAPALLYQLLGDVYRRMGRMQEAVAHYREAINRM
jgi:tetratricopeptide (TPR) repeat protein